MNACNTGSSAKEATCSASNKAMARRDPRRAGEGERNRGIFIRLRMSPDSERAAWLSGATV